MSGRRVERVRPVGEGDRVRCWAVGCRRWSTSGAIPLHLTATITIRAVFCDECRDELLTFSLRRDQLPGSRRPTLAPA